jgi:phosphohistidine phosphatase
VSPRDQVRQLYLLRHANAGDPAAWTGDDAARPLSDQGRRQAEQLGAFLAAAGFQPDAIISSPKVRARETAEYLAAALGMKVRFDDRLAGSFEPATVDAILADAGDPVRPVLVGHDPEFSELLRRLTGAPGVSMKKGAFARIDVRGPVADEQGTLRWLVSPDLLDPDRH